MVFSSLEFIFIFLPAFMLVYAGSPAKYKNAVIFAGSVIFYSMGVKKPVYIILFLLTLLFDFIIAQFIESFRRTSRLWLTVGIVFNFWWLIFFKYWGFGTENINALFHAGLTVKDIILPIGISFYTFQNVSYIIDVYRKKARAEKDLISYGAYISMFPQLIAGPIVTYESVAHQLRHRTHSIRKVEDGLKTFTIGLGYSPPGQPGRRPMERYTQYRLPEHLRQTGMDGHFRLLLPALLRLLRLLPHGYRPRQGNGIRPSQELRPPLYLKDHDGILARWHMTLGSWFRDYIYIPLGGNRCSKRRMLFNTFCVWLFTGLWHGASWNFVIWGLVLFLIMTIEKNGLGDFMNKHKLAGHAYMILLIPLTWLIFAITDMDQMRTYFSRLLPFAHKASSVLKKDDYVKYWRIYRKYFLFGTVFSTPIPAIIYKKIKSSLFTTLVLLVVFWASVYCMYKGMDDPFMYFRF